MSARGKEKIRVTIYGKNSVTGTICLSTEKTRFFGFQKYTVKIWHGHKNFKGKMKIVRKKNTIGRNIQVFLGYF